jgi:hypothetical protein
MSWRDTLLLLSPPTQWAIVACWYALVVNKVVAKGPSLVAVMLVCGTMTAGLNIFNLPYVRQILPDRFLFVLTVALEEQGVVVMLLLALWRLSKPVPRSKSVGRDAWELLRHSFPPRT